MEVHEWQQRNCNSQDKVIIIFETHGFNAVPRQIPTHSRQYKIQFPQINQNTCKYALGIETGEPAKE